MAEPIPQAFGMSYDAIELLPPDAADKLRKLRLRKDDAHRLIPEFETVRSASLAKIEAANALKRLKDHPQDFGRNLREDNPLVIEATKHLDKMTADFKRLTELQEVRSAAFQSASAALANVETWLKSGRPGGTVLQDYEGEPPPKLLKGETSLIEAIENRRRRGRELRADLHRIKSAPYPSSYAKQQMRAQIEALAMQGAPVVSDVIEHDRKVVWLTTRLQSSVYNIETPGIAFAEVPDAVALIAWLHKDTLIKRLDAEIDVEADDAAALAHEQRQQREAEAQGDLLDIERQEAALAWRAQSEGLPCEHRADINPVALLGVVLVTAPRAPSGPSSPEHAGYNLIGGR